MRINNIQFLQLYLLKYCTHIGKYIYNYITKKDKDALLLRCGPK